MSNIEYPPSVVHLSPHRIGRHTPETDSPLSTAPNSPNAEMGSRSRPVADIMMTIDEQEGKHSRRKSDVIPFDEGCEDDHPDDEKKIEETVDKIPSTAASRSSEALALARRRVRRMGPPEGGPEDATTPLVLTKAGRPSMLSQRAKTTGSILDYRSNSSRMVTPASTIRGEMDRDVEMEQHLNFAALKRDILLASWRQTNNNDITASDAATSGPMATPSPMLQSPPKLYPRRGLEFEEFQQQPLPKHRLALDSKRDELSGPPAVEYAMSKDSTTVSSREGAWPSFYSTSYSYETDGRTKSAEEQEANTTTKPAFRTLPAIVSPEPYPPSDDSDADATPIATTQSLRGLSASASSASEKQSTSTAVTDNRRRSESPKVKSPVVVGSSASRFHPSAAVYVDHDNDVDYVPKDNNSVEPQETADYHEHDATRAHPWNGVLVDAMELASSGATAVGDYVFGEAEKTAVGDYGETEKKSRLSSGSSSRVGPVSTRSRSDESGTNWETYLERRGMPATSTSAATTELLKGKDGWLTGSTNEEPSAAVTYREMTPKKDFQSSEKSSWWLQAELKRRTIVKKEINTAILARNEPPVRNEPSGDAFASALTKRLVAVENDENEYHDRPDHDEDDMSNEPAEADAMSDESIYTSTEDEEVAAYTEDDLNDSAMWQEAEKDLASRRQRFNSEAGAEESTEFALPRRLEFNETDSSRDDKVRRGDDYDRVRKQEDLGESGHYSLGTASSNQREAPRLTKSSFHSADESGYGESQPLDMGHGRYDIIPPQVSDDAEHRRDFSEPLCVERNDSEIIYPVALHSEDIEVGFDSSSALLSNSVSRDKIDLRAEMKRFASDTRAALRGMKPASDPGAGSKENTGSSEQGLSDSLFRSIAIASSMSSAIPDDMQSVEVSASMKEYPKIIAKYSVSEDRSTRSGRPRGLGRIASSGSGRSAAETNSDSNTTGASEFAELHTGVTPVLVQSMDSVYGIPKGDITLSLLNDNTGTETSKNATWAGRVHSAIWRCRKMRRAMGTVADFGETNEHPAGTPPRGRSSLPVDMDKARVAGGFRSVASTQDAALAHLKHDEIEKAMELFEDIIFAYYAYFEQSLKLREKNPLQSGLAPTDFKPFIGVALHNLGILNLLNGDYSEALSFFSRAVENRRSCLGEGHPDHLVSLVKLAVCLYALNDFGEAHAKLEEALKLAKMNATSLDDRVQIAEILNNLGCLTYMCGQPVACKDYFRESLDVQFDALSESLYGESSLTCHSISLSISITRANIGFVKLVMKDLPVAITALEAALMEQQILLRGAHDTLIATMDHLAVANLLNGNPQKSAEMFGRILQLQYNAYGPHDRRCFVTIDKINMVRSQGENFKDAVEELQKTFSVPLVGTPSQVAPPSVEEMSTGSSKAKSQGAPSTKGKSQKTNKVFKVLTSMRKKKPAVQR